MIDEKKLIEEIRNLKKHYDFFYKKGKSEIDDIVKNASDTLFNDIAKIIYDQPKVGEWIPCSERLPENAKHKGAFCPKYQVKTKYGLTQGWYNPDVESWYCLFWFLLGRYDETDIDLEKGDKPKVIRVPDGTGIVIAWKEPSEPWKGENE